MYFSPVWQTNKSQDPGPSSSTSNGKEAEEPDDDDIDVDDDLDIDELNELEASLSRTSIQIREPGEGTSSWAVLQWKIVAKLLSIFALPSDLVAFANKEPWSADASGIDLLALFTSYLEGATINKWRPVLWSHMTIDVCCVPYFFILCPLWEICCYLWITGLNILLAFRRLNRILKWTLRWISMIFAFQTCTM